MPVEVQGTLDLSGILADGRVMEDGDLTIKINSFYYEIAGNRGYFPGVLGVAVTDNTTNYVFMDSDGYAIVNDTGYPGSVHLRLARVITSGGYVVRVISERALFSTLGAGALSNPMTTQGDIIVGGSAGVPVRLAGQDGYYLRSKGSVASPLWVRTLDVSGIVISDVIDDTLSSSAIFEAKATDKGVLLPSLTNAEMLAIPGPDPGLLIYENEAKRFKWYDGSRWRSIITTPQSVITVAPDGSADYLTIQGAIDSIAGESDVNRFIIDVAPAIYSEVIYPKGYVTIQGTGWDTVLDGYIVFEHALGDANIKDIRITTLNEPSVIVNTDDEADLIGVFIQTTYNNSAPAATVRSSINLLKGTLYTYKESEIYVESTENISTDPSLIYTCYYLDGIETIYHESYGTFHYMDIENQYNEINIVTSTNDNADSYNWIKNCYTTITFMGLVHTNNVIFSNLLSGASGFLIADGGRVDLEASIPINPLIYLAACDSASSSLGHSRWNRMIIRKVNIPDANFSLGYSTTTNDEVFTVEDVFLFTNDVLPVQYTVPGSLGIFNYSISNNFGSRSFTGTLNGTRYYAASAADPVSPAPNNGDKYYNTSISELMYYDTGRGKWLSYNGLNFFGGRNGNTAAGSYYKGIDGLTFTSSIGYVVPKGTLVSLSINKADSNNTTLEVLVDAVQIATLVCNGTGNFINTSMNADFDAGLLNFRNLSSGDVTTNVQIVASIKRRA